VFISPTSGIRAHDSVGQKVARLLEALLQMEWRWIPFTVGARRNITPSKPIKPTQIILEKRPNK